jgi:hypothetical protein
MHRTPDLTEPQRARSELTMAPGILTVGGNGFFARCFASACADLDIRHVSIVDLDRPDVYKGIGTVGEFAFNPRLYREAYEPTLDVDGMIAATIAERPPHCVLKSSRAVHGADGKWNDLEAAETVGYGVYGINCIAVERAVRERPYS